ncbi:MAG: hypothetical protein AAF518_01715 [Spirochaetota bacterium]
MSNFARAIANFLYRVNAKKKAFAQANPNEPILACEAAKAIELSEDKDPAYGAEWVTSKRSIFLMTEQKIYIGKWEIPLEQITKAELLKFSSLYGKGMLLKFTTQQGKYYQVGMSDSPELEQQTVLHVEIRTQKLKYSFLSIIARIVLLAYLVYIVWKKFL